MPTLFDPVRFGDIELANRLVMAPLTRNRARNQVVGDLHVEYYRQRASAGLLITEATQIRPDGQGYFDTPGIHTPEQIAAWRRVTDAVHAEGGKIVVQLWHVGRISVKRLQPGGQPPVSSTNRAAKTRTYAAHGELVPTDEPRALATEEIPQLIADYAQAAKNAIAAGFDGVEVHSANGYLLEQFLRDSANDRTDRYGGSIENRARLLLEVMRAVTQEIGGERTGLRLSRTGSWDHFDVQPDLSCWGKTIGGGHAIAMLLGNDKARQAAQGIFVTGSFWYSATPMAAALETLKLVRSTDYLEHTHRIGDALRAGIAEQALRHGFVLKQTGPSVMPQMLFDGDNATLTLGRTWTSETVKRGAFLHPYHNMFMCAAMTDADVAHTLQATEDAFKVLKATVKLPLAA